MCRRAHSLAVRDPGSCSSAWSGQMGPAALTTAPMLFSNHCGHEMKESCFSMLPGVVMGRGLVGNEKEEEGRIHALVQVPVKPWFEARGDTPQAVKGRHFFS